MPTFAEALRVWLRVAAQSFGGPAGQIAVMHRILVEEKRWVSEDRFLHALSYCMLLPGPEAQQLATYIGWLLHGTRGGIVAGTLFVLPGFLAILALSLLYVGFQETAWLSGLFFGLKAAVLVVVIQALVRIGRRALANGMLVALAVAAFLALALFAVPFPAVVVGAALVGGAGGRLWPSLFPAPGHAAEAAGAPAEGAGRAAGWRRSLAVVLVCGLLWAVPVAALWLVRGRQDVLTTEALFFSQAAMVTFGGAYAVLSYVGQQAVSTYGWLTPGEMLDGLGMAETTPGPLIQVVQFVGFLGAFRNPGSLDPWLAGLLGALVVTWVTYVPCFLWIFLGAPYIERLRRNRTLGAALAAITAAVVGVIAHLALWFALHTLFGRVEETSLGILHLAVPDLGSINPTACALALLAALALFRFRLGMGWVLGGCAVLGWVTRILG